MVKNQNITIPAQAGIRHTAKPSFINALRADQTPAFAGVVVKGRIVHG